MYDTANNYNLQVIITSGHEAPHRALAGFALALSAVASGLKVVVWLTMYGVQWAGKNPASHEIIPGFISIAEHIQQLNEANVRIEVCPTCREQGNMLSGTGCGLGRPWNNYAPAGLATIVSRLTTVPTVTF